MGNAPPPPPPPPPHLALRAAISEKKAPLAKVNQMLLTYHSCRSVPSDDF